MGRNFLYVNLALGWSPGSDLMGWTLYLVEVVRVPVRAEWKLSQDDFGQYDLEGCHDDYDDGT